MVPTHRVLPLSGAADVGVIEVGGEPLILGRSPSCDFVISGEGVSREHVKLQVLQGRCYLLDLFSTTGTRVNGMPVKRQMLLDGDEITVGSARFRYQMEGGARTPGNTTALRHGSALLHEWIRDVLEDSESGRLRARGPDDETAVRRPQNVSQELETLYALSRELVHIFDPAELAQAIVHKAHEVLQAQIAALVVFPELPGTPQVHALPRLPDETAQVFIRLGQFVTGRARALRLSVGDDLSGFDPKALLGRGASILAAPLRCRGTAQGALIVMRPHGQEAYSPQDQLFLATFCNQSSVALEAAGTYGNLIDRIFESTSDLFVMVDPQGLVVRLNRAAQVTLGLDETQARRQRFLDRVAPEDRERAQTFLSTLIRLATIDPVELRLLGLRGRATPMSVAGFPIREGGGDLIGIGIIARNLSGKEVVLKDLEAANAQLAQASQVKTSFVAMVAHELQNPLFVFDLVREGLEPLVGDRPEAAEYLETFGRTLRKVSHLIHDLLDLSKLEAGRLVLELADGDLSDVVREVAQEFRLLAGHGEVDLALELEPARTRVDGGRFAIVLRNLLGNALKFTPEKGRIVVRCGTRDGLAFMAVADTGAGIPADLLPHIFKPFEQGPGPSPARRSGVGLGLHIARSLVVAHGGTIAAQSTLGRGTTITVELPSAST